MTEALAKWWQGQGRPSAVLALATPPTECPVCGDAGFMRAAPVSAAGPFAMWQRAVTIPCWACRND